MAVHGPADLDEAARPEERRRLRPHDVGPATLGGALPQDGAELLVQAPRRRSVVVGALEGDGHGCSRITSRLPSGSRNANIGGTKSPIRMISASASTPA